MTDVLSGVFETKEGRHKDPD